MRSLWIGAALLGWLGVAHAERRAGMLDCLHPGEMRETVADNKVVAPAMAVVTARHAVPGAEIVRANLCRVENHLLYIIMALRRDGRFVYVTIDAVSGRVKTVQ
ncbi:MAG TPA: hypothetical protein VF601_18535 [Beijerinckiaceae bacterium]|jgi:uncharacterized membrane protein YkoI